MPELDKEYSKREIINYLQNNKQLRLYLIKIFWKFYIDNININEITHLAIEHNQSNNSIKNTLTDFFIMSKSNKIYALSPYGHRTGFSEYCSKIFIIPYEFYNLNIRT